LIAKTLITSSLSGDIAGSTNLLVSRTTGPPCCLFFCRDSFLLYNCRMASTKTQVYRPDVLSRRNEFIAWGSFAAAGLGVLFFQNYANAVLPQWVTFGVGVLFVLAGGLSLGNWMDRRTSLQFSAEGLEFRNGLRHIQMSWQEVGALQIMPSRLGKAVRVTGRKGRFSFTVAGGLKIRGNTQGKFGFANGDEIIKEIVRRGGLSLISHSAATTYYARS